MKKILLVDDECFIHFLYRSILGEKYNIESVTDPFEALEKIKAQEYSLILVDINMPYINGLEIIESTRKKGVFTPIIVVSSYGSGEKKKEASDKGANDYIEKPIDTDELKSKIEKWCK